MTTKVPVSTLPSVCTIYKRTNMVNGKVYVGQTWQTIEDRAGTNGRNYNGCVLFWNAIQKHGWTNFETEELYTCCDQETADYYENNFQELYDSCNPEKGYNIRKGGATGRAAEETKTKIAQSMKQHVRTEEHCRNIAMAKMGEKNPAFGKSHSEEHKKKVSQAIAGKPGRGKLTQEQIDEIRSAFTSDIPPTRKEMAEKLGVSVGTIRNVLLNKILVYQDEALMAEHPPVKSLTVPEVKEIKSLLRVGELSHRNIATIFGVSPNCIREIKIGNTWKDIE